MDDEENMVSLIKNTSRRIWDRVRYGIPLVNRSAASEGFIDIFKAIGPIKSCAVIGRGASILQCNPYTMIKSCDFKVIMNRVEIEKLTHFLGDQIDAQIAQPPGGLITVLPKSLINKFGLKVLISNKLKNSDKFRRFYQAYWNREIPISCVPDDSDMKYDFCRYSYPHRTQCGSLLKILYNIDTLEKIVFAGVDFFRFDYVTQGGDMRVFPRMIDDAQQEKGDPLFKFITETVPKRNAISPLTVYFPDILKPLINFPALPCFQFYQASEASCESHL